MALGIGNGRQAGGGHELCPQALADDGLLDVSILPAPQEVVGTVKNLMAGGWGLDNLFVRARLPWVEIKAAQGLALNLDGEPLTGELALQRTQRRVARAFAAKLTAVEFLKAKDVIWPLFLGCEGR